MHVSLLLWIVYAITVATARASDNFDLIKKRPKNDEQVKLIKENKQEQMEELDCIPSQSDLIEFFSSSALPPCQLPLESSRSQSTAAQLLTTAHSVSDLQLFH